jgi:hypothetical protein
VTSALLMTMVAPLWLLAVGPVVLGVPHLLADLRYLVVQPGLHRRRALWPAVVPLVLGAISASLVVSLLSVLTVVAVARAPLPRRALIGLGVGALCAAASVAPDTFTLVFMHVHNVIALVVWAWLRRGPVRTALAMVLTTLGAALALLLGLADPIIGVAQGWVAPATGASFDDFIAAVAPALDGPTAAHVVLSFAFLKSVHYGVWLRLVPDDQRSRVAPRPFLASWRALVTDFGFSPMVVITALAMGVAVWGALDLTAARLGYLRLGGFHGTLELAVLVLLLTERWRRP